MGLIGHSSRRAPAPTVPAPVPLPEQAQVDTKAEAARKKMMAMAGRQGTVLAGTSLGNTSSKQTLLGLV